DRAIARITAPLTGGPYAWRGANLGFARVEATLIERRTELLIRQRPALPASVDQRHDLANARLAKEPSGIIEAPGNVRWLVRVRGDRHRDAEIAAAAEDARTRVRLAVGAA